MCYKTWFVTKGQVVTQRSHGCCGLGPCGQVQRRQDFKRCVKFEEKVGEVQKVLPLHVILLEILDAELTVPHVVFSLTGVCKNLMACQ